MNTPPLNYRFGLICVISTVVAVCVLTAASLAQGNTYPTVAPIRWETNIDAAMARAEREQRPIFIHFIGNDCQPAQQMAFEVFSQPNIIARLNSTFVMVRINASENEALAQTFAVKSVPSDLVLKPNGQLIHRRTGGISAERFISYLDYLQNMLQSEKSPMANPPVANPVPVVNPLGASNPQPMPPQREMSPFPGTARDPFAQQSPTAYPCMPPVTETVSVPPKSNPLRSDEIPAKPPAEYVAFPPQVPVSVTVPPGATIMPSIANLMAREPAPSKTMVEVPLALEGYCPVTLCTEEKWVSGNPAYCTMYQGHIFRFATADNLATFVRNPAIYMPVAMGEDIVLMVDRNKRINGNRQFGAWYQGRVFLFSSQEALNVFSERPEYYTEIALKYEMARKEQGSPLVY